MNKGVLLAWAIKNTIVLICFTILAVIFNKWWIILFSMLLMTFCQTGYKCYRVCDKCGKHSPYADSYNEALDKAKEAGWIHVTEGNMDYCPDCKEKMILTNES